MASDAQRGREQRRHRLLHERPPGAREQLGGRGRRQLLARPARGGAGRRVQVGPRDSLGPAHEQIGEVDPRDFFSHVVLGQHAPADHDADALGHALPVVRDQRGVRDRQPQWISKDRGHR